MHCLSYILTLFTAQKDCIGFSENVICNFFFFSRCLVLTLKAEIVHSPVLNDNWTPEREDMRDEVTTASVTIPLGKCLAKFRRLTLAVLSTYPEYVHSTFWAALTSGWLKNILLFLSALSHVIIFIEWFSFFMYMASVHCDFLSKIRIVSSVRDVCLRLQSYLSHFCSFE